MPNIHLVRPEEKDEACWMKAMGEYAKLNEEIVPYAFQSGCMNYGNFLKVTRDKRNGINLQKGFVPSDLFFAKQDNSNEIIGAVDIRYILNDYLYNFAGHIGYGIVPSFRNRGYGVYLLRKAMQICKSENMHRVLITCMDTNIKSQKIISACGGIYLNTTTENGILINRYEIVLE